MSKAVIVQKMNAALKHIQQIKNPIVWIIVFYLSFVASTLLLWLCCWILSAFYKVPDLNVGLKFIDQLTNMTFIGFVCFIGGCFIDLNKNGIPDGIESKIDIKKPLDNLLGLRKHPDGE